MDVYEFALQMEKDGENYYRELVSGCKIVGLQKIFTLLADEEVKHYTFIQQIQLNNSLTPIKDTEILKNVKNIFTEMSDGKQYPSQSSTDSVSAFEKACKIEGMSREFYLKQAQEVKDEQAKLLLNQLAKEEEKHLHIMENIVEFVSRPEPGNWLENAEWHHLDEY